MTSSPSGPQRGLPDAPGSSRRRLELDGALDLGPFRFGPDTDGKPSELFRRARRLRRSNSSWKASAATSSPRLRLFAYAVGFGNPLGFLLGDSGPKVRDISRCTLGSTVP